MYKISLNHIPLNFKDNLIRLFILLFNYFLSEKFLKQPHWAPRKKKHLKHAYRFTGTKMWLQNYSREVILSWSVWGWYVILIWYLTDDVRCILDNNVSGISFISAINNLDKKLKSNMLIYFYIWAWSTFLNTIWFWIEFTLKYF